MMWPQLKLVRINPPFSRVGPMYSPSMCLLNNADLEVPQQEAKVTTAGLHDKCLAAKCTCRILQISPFRN